MQQISDKTTEQQNQASKYIDQMNIEEILVIMNEEDKTVPHAVAKAIPEIEKFVDAVVTSMKKGGSLYYVGAGTSGRLGVLDASEIPPYLFSISQTCTRHHVWWIISFSYSC